MCTNTPSWVAGLSGCLLPSDTLTSSFDYLTPNQQTTFRTIHPFPQTKRQVNPAIVQGARLSQQPEATMQPQVKAGSEFEAAPGWARRPASVTGAVAHAWAENDCILLVQTEKAAIVNDLTQRVDSPGWAKGPASVTDEEASGWAEKDCMSQDLRFLLPLTAPFEALLVQSIARWRPSGSSGTLLLVTLAKRSVTILMSASSAPSLFTHSSPSASYGRTKLSLNLKTSC